MTRRQRIVLLIGFILVLNTAVFAQRAPASSSSQPGAGTRRAFTLYGDLKVEDSSDSQATTMFDVILYTRGNEVFARQRVGNGGRYRFNNIFNGDYYLAVELDNVEVARVPLLISENAVEHIKQDLDLKWKGGARPAPGVVSAADAYSRSRANASLFDQAMKEMKKNELNKATQSLRSVVEADPKDFPAWNELGMVYFIQKDLEAAANSYVKAIELKPDYVTALVSLGRVRLAQKSNEEAVKVLETAVKADAKSASANYFLGEAYLAVRKGSLAVGYLNESIKLDPVGMANAHLRLGTLYNLAGRKEQAALEYNEFLKKKPDYPEAQKLRDYIIANGPKRDAAPAPSPSPNP
ncbi:MAG TPA: tetratricopeptide repeat protein [Pyrinomonadaceae bacterium]|nr:tetratricopeptide repeat protein [Pyrinomonadaceae bacterium]